MMHEDATCDGRVMTLAIRLFFALADGEPPEWIHLVPAGTFRGTDGRGPYTLADAAEAIRLSMQAGKLPIDENHAIDLAAPDGRPSPARGWIVGLEARDDGIWGRVEWTPAGKALMAEKAYRGISPALLTEEKTGRVVAVARASLTNNPNLNLTSLHSQGNQDMSLLEKLRAALGLASDATEDAVIAGATAARTAITTHATQLAEIAEAAGLAKDLKPAELVVQLQAKKTAGGEADELRTTVVALQTKIETMQQATARSAAERAIDDAIKAGKVGLKPLRDHYITRHMADPVGVDKEIAAMVSLHGTPLVPRDPTADPKTALTADEERAISLMGVSREAFLKSRAELNLETV